jgi:hypothetical protein
MGLDNLLHDALAATPPTAARKEDGRGEAASA